MKFGTPVITPTDHAKTEWSRLAQAAYACGRNSIGHRYSVAASLPHNGAMALDHFDDLQSLYRGWLIGGFAEFDARLTRAAQEG